MPNDRFIAREDDVLDLETGIRYSTADDAEAVADLLNSTPSQVAAELQGAIAELAGPFGRMALELGTSHEAVRKGNVAFAKLRAAAALASPEPESVVLEGDFETRTTINDDKPDESVTCLYVGGVEVGGEIADAAGVGEFYDNDGSPERTFGMRYGPVRLTITPIKERGE